MDQNLDFDLVVVGESVAGIGAALEATRRGRRVGLVGVRGEQVLRGQFAIGPTPLNEQVSREFEDLARKALRSAGACWLEGASAVALRRNDRGFVCELEELMSGSPRRVLGTRLLLATQPDLDPRAQLPEFAAYTGRGVSLCAWSDAIFYKGQNVAVSGDGRLAADQALFALAAGCHVELISSSGEVSAPDWMQTKLRGHGPRFCQRAGSVVGLCADTRGELESVQLAKGRLPCKGLFLAQPTHDPWQALPAELGAALLRDTPGFGVVGALEGTCPTSDSARFGQGASAVRTMYPPC